MYMDKTLIANWMALRTGRALNLVDEICLPMNKEYDLSFLKVTVVSSKSTNIYPLLIADCIGKAICYINGGKSITAHSNEI